jgi:integrase
MSEDKQFYEYCRSYDYHRTLQTAIDKSEITLSDKSLILEYLTEKQASDDLSDIRCNKITSHLVNWRRFLKTEYSNCSITDIYQAINNLQKGKTRKGKPYKQNTKRDYVLILKPFLIWLNINGYNKLPIEKIKKISNPKAERMTKTPDQILSLEEIKKLKDSCKNNRDRALIMVLYESGCRIAELGRLKWKNAIFEDLGVKLYLDDRKGKQYRYSRLTMSAEYLASWKKDYPDYDPDKHVFVDLNSYAPMGYDTMVRAISRVAERAKIEKKVHPHIFRTSRITHMINQNYQESVIKKSMWGNINTEMFATYVCLSEEDIDNEFLAKAGIIKPEEKVNPLLPITCGECHNINAADSIFCGKCGFPLTPEAENLMLKHLDDYIDDIESDPDFEPLNDDYKKFESSAREKLNK